MKTFGTQVLEDLAQNGISQSVIESACGITSDQLARVISEERPFCLPKEMFVQAVDMIVQVGWLNGGRSMIGVWEVEKTLKGGNIQFRQLYKPGDAELLPIGIERRV